MNIPLLSLSAQSKSFPGVQALSNAHMEVRAGEVHCLLGENGAGKSTMMKIIAGSQVADSGEMRINGEVYLPQSPHHAQTLGVGIIHQELNLCQEMSVAQNIMLGHEARRGAWPILDHRTIHEEARALLARVGVSVDVEQPVSVSSIAQQQMFEIAKALSFNPKILIMDEPTTALTSHEIEHLFQLIHRLKNEGVGVVYISHRLEEIFEIGDRVTILRDGKHVLTQDTSALTKDSIIAAMVGRSLEEEFPSRDIQRGKACLQVNNFSRENAFQDISFTLHQGEVLGLTGLVGAGRTEVARAIFGAEPADSGSIWMDGEQVYIQSPQVAIAHGIGLIPEDRKEQGFIGALSICENLILANLSHFTDKGVINGTAESSEAKKYIDQMSIRTPSVAQSVGNLSGGNQQKVVLAKWLATQCTCLIFDEPTRGVDVGAKTEIYTLMNELLAEGVSILMISSDLPEVLGMSDRILVMCEGQISGELSKEDATQESIMQLAMGNPQPSETK